MLNLPKAMIVFWGLSYAAFGCVSVSPNIIQDPTLHSSTAFDSAQLIKQNKIAIQANRFIDEHNETFVFKGFNIASPEKLIKDGKWDKAIFAEIKRWGANTVRLPVHPIGWRRYGEDEYLKLIDQAVVWANELDLYLIIDWHSIGYLLNETFQNPIYETTVEETLRFWQLVARRYANIPTLAAYEIFNEPTDKHSKTGRENWAEWKAFNERAIDIIQAFDDQTIILVAGFNWAYELKNAKQAPIERTGVGYVSHPYPQKERPNPRTKEALFKRWTAAWGILAEDYPIILTELGWVAEDGHGAHIPVIDDGSYGPYIMEYIQQNGLSWTAWCFDPNWSPTIIQDWSYTPTEQGEFFKQVLADQQ
ncbi:glycoside hydrolase family 5 protein [Glaciecola sp. 1036]|uniref:glycoside hydrolase family 5 protein n=1 Tax=Alteromonadaceae TaxID=72275 RepID=UPI003CFEE995